VAPPDWAFALVWLVLNVKSLVALPRIANAPDRSTMWMVFLWSEGMGWVLFSAFTTLHFLLRSPVLGAADTVARLIVGLVSLVPLRATRVNNAFSLDSVILGLAGVTTVLPTEAFWGASSSISLMNLLAYFEFVAKPSL
jgi:hypothetical protein